MRFTLVTLFAFATMAMATPALEARTKSNCASSKQFWYSTRNCCLDRGGPKVMPTPPKGRDCPRDYYWHNQQGCCTPKDEPKKDMPEPQCPKKNWKWKKSTQCCEEDDHPTPVNPPTTSPKPQNPGKDKDCDDKDKGKGKGNDNHNDRDGDKDKDKGRNHHKRAARSLKSREESLCPAEMEACPVGKSDGQFECISPLEDIRACGGCPSFGKGQDCTAITGAEVVTCDIGSCAVQTCKNGLEISPDGKSCVAV